MKKLDRKLATIQAGAYTPDDFVIADAKDADMAWGVASPGPAAGGRGGFKTRRQYVDEMVALVAQGEVDIMLASASNVELLARKEAVQASEVTLAIRANDTTDIWYPRGATYHREPSRPFRSATLELVRPFCDLGLYSVTFNNDLDRDQATLEAYARFRGEARRLGFRHFLEVFNPNAPVGLAPEAEPAFVNDCIARALAGVTSAERPLFLKIVYNGPRALEELAAYDASLVVGILGGTAGTTRDTYELLAQGARHGAKVALFGRKIKLAESPLDLVALMRPVVRGELSSAEAVRAYHAALQKLALQPVRSLADDSVITERALQAG